MSTLFKKLFVLFKFVDPKYFSPTTDPSRKTEYANYKESVTLFEEIKNDRGRAICLNNMGNIKYDQQKYAKAIDLFKEALTFTEDLYETVEK